MLHVLLNDDPWFEPKRYGYGSGLPCAWQGWALLLGFIALSTVWGFAMTAGHIAIGVVGLLLTLIPFLWLTKRHTRGGWRWRN